MISWIWKTINFLWKFRQLSWEALCEEFGDYLARPFINGTDMVSDFVLYVDIKDSVLVT